MITNDDTAVANTLTVSTKTWKYACFGTVKAMISQRTFCKGNVKDYMYVDSNKQNNNIINKHRYWYPCCFFLEEVMLRKK